MRIIALFWQKSMKKAEELAVITKTYDLILWSCNHTSRFPRNHRFVLGDRIERNLYGLLETLIAARYTKDRRRLLEDANLSPWRSSGSTMRLAKDLRCLKVESSPSPRSRSGSGTAGRRLAAGTPGGGEPE